MSIPELIKATSKTKDMTVTIKGKEYTSSTIYLFGRSRTVKLDFGIKFRLGKEEFEAIKRQLNQ